MSAAGNSPRAAVGKAPIADLADDPPALRLDVGLGQLDLGEDPGGVVGEQPAGVGEPHPAAVLGQQRLPDLPLQLRHLLGDRRGGDVQPVRPHH